MMGSFDTLIEQIQSYFNCDRAKAIAIYDKYCVCSNLNKLLALVKFCA